MAPSKVLQQKWYALPLTALATDAAVVAVLARDVDARRRCLLGLGGVDDAGLDVGGQAVEGLVDVDAALGRDLEEGNAELVGQLLALFGGDDALLLPVALVANQNLVDALGGVLLDVGEPRADVCRVSKGVLERGDVEGVDSLSNDRSSVTS